MIDMLHGFIEHVNIFRIRFLWKSRILNYTLIFWNFLKLTIWTM